MHSKVKFIGLIVVILIALSDYSFAAKRKRVEAENSAEKVSYDTAFESAAKKSRIEESRVDFREDKVPVVVCCAIYACEESSTFLQMHCCGQWVCDVCIGFLKDRISTLVRTRDEVARVERFARLEVNVKDISNVSFLCPLCRTPIMKGKELKQITQKISTKGTREEAAEVATVPLKNQSFLWKLWDIIRNHDFLGF